jgi:glycosyltransferase involved in cell wall biosynthesis
MKVTNISNNTLYVRDLDFDIPYESGAVIELTPDQLKKSNALRSFVLGGMLKVLEYNQDEPVESALIYLKKKRQTVQQKLAEINPREQQEEPPPAITAPLLARMDSDLEVKFSGLFYDDSGYAKVNRNVALRLAQMGVKLQVAPKNSKNRLTEDEIKPLIDLEKVRLSKNHIRIDSVVPSFGDIASARYKILYTTTESYTIPNQFVQCCEMYDEIWVTSPWSAQILGKCVTKPIYVIPAGVDEQLYNENGTAFNFAPNVRDFVFISVFGWSYRKGYDVLLKAYFDEFSNDDPVTLLIVSKYRGGNSQYHRNKIRDDIESIMRKFPNKDLPHLLRHSQLIAERDMPKMYRGAHAFVLPSRGEGSNLCGVEASLCGLPVIMTNCSGQTMYLRRDNAFLIEPDTIQPIERGKMNVHYWDDQEFPSLTSPDVHQQVRKAMRHVFQNYAEAKERNKRLQRLILSKFTWNHTANAAVERLKDIAEKMKG